MNEKTHLEPEKKEWEKPQLIILSRGEPEEAVLGACKITTELSSSGTCSNLGCSGPSVS